MNEVDVLTTQVIGSKYGFGIPDDLIMKMQSRWIPIGNNKFLDSAKFRRRHHYQVCPECGEKKKNIRVHYRKYHRDFWYRFFIKPLEQGTIGEIYSVRFIETS